MGLKKFLEDKKNEKIAKKCARAWELLKHSETYATSNQFIVRLVSDITDLKPFFEKMKEEGYNFKYDVVEGDLFSSSIVYVTVTKKDAMKNYLENNRKD